MKHSSTWFALTLIALALFLSAAKSEARPNEKQTSNQKKVESGDAASTPVLTHDHQNDHDADTDAGAKNTYNYNGDFNYIAPRQASPFWAIAAEIATVASAIFALGVLCVAYWGGKIAIRTLVAIEAQSALATHTLTNLERPWISIPNVKGGFVGTDPDLYEIFEIAFEVANTGRSPAMIISTLSATRFTENIGSLSKEPQYPPIEVGIGRGTLGVSEKMHSDMAIRLRRIDAQKILDGTATLMFFGQVIYKAPWELPADAPHETRFCLFYGPPRAFRAPGTDHPGEFHFAGPEAYNRWT